MESEGICRTARQVCLYRSPADTCTAGPLYGNLRARATMQPDRYSSLPDLGLGRGQCATVRAIRRTRMTCKDAWKREGAGGVLKGCELLSRFLPCNRFASSLNEHIGRRRPLTILPRQIGENEPVSRSNRSR